MKVVSILEPKIKGRGKTPLPFWYSLNAESLPSIISSEGSTPSTENDLVFSNYTPAVIDNGAVIFATLEYGFGQGVVTWESSDESIATLINKTDPLVCRLSRVSDGTVIVTRTQGEVIHRIPVSVNREMGASAKILIGFVDGSLGKHCTTAIDSRLVGKDASQSLSVFTTQNHTGATYVRNPNLWCSDIVQKLTCCSPWNSTGGATRAGTLVTPRHIVYAAHYPINDNSIVRFVAADGMVHSRTQTKHKVHPEYFPWWFDLVIGVLDSDLPVDITPCLVAPDNFESYLHGLGKVYPTPRIPTIGFTQQEKATVQDLVALEGNSANTYTPIDAKRLEFFIPKVGGDSGNPVFLIVNNEVVLQTVWTWAEAGTDIGDNVTALNQMIVDADTLAGISTVADPTWPNAGGHYKLKEVDLSGFPSY